MATWYVSNVAMNGYALGVDTNAGTSQATPFLTIQKAITSASSGDTIIVNPTSSSTTSANNPYSETGGSGLNTSSKALTIEADQNYPSTYAVVQSTYATSVVVCQNETSLTFTGLVIDTQGVSSKHAFKFNTQPSVTLSKVLIVNGASGSSLMTDVGSGTSVYVLDRLTLDPSNAYVDFFIATALTGGSITVQGGTYAMASNTSGYIIYTVGSSLSAITTTKDITGANVSISGNGQFMKPGTVGTLTLNYCTINNAYAVINFAAGSSSVTTALNCSYNNVTYGSNSALSFIGNLCESVTLGTISNNTIGSWPATGGISLDLHNGKGSPLVFNNTVAMNYAGHAFQLGSDGFNLDQSNSGGTASGQNLCDVSGDTYVDFFVTTTALTNSSHSSYIANITVFLKSAGSPTGNVTCSLYSDSSGNPGTLLAASDTTLAATGITSSYQQFQFDFNYLTKINPGTKIHFVFTYSGTQDNTNYVIMEQNTTVTSGNTLTSANGSSWTPNASNQLLFYLNTGTYGIVDARVYGNTITCPGTAGLSGIVHAISMSAQVRGWCYGNQIYGGSLGVMFKENKGGSSGNMALAFDNLIYSNCSGFDDVGLLYAKGSQWVGFYQNTVIVDSTNSQGPALCVGPDTAFGSVAAQNQLQSNNIVAKNNILVQLCSGQAAYLTIATPAGVGPTSLTIDYNDVYVPNGGYYGTLINNSYSTFSGWQAQGYDTDGMSANPKLQTLQPTTPQGFVPLLSSPVIGAGVNLQGVAAADFYGRPFSTTPTLGPFQLVAVSAIMPLGRIRNRLRPWLKVRRN